MLTSARQLGWISATALVVANMIGVGVFTSTGFQAASLHDPLTILLCWVVGGVLALCGAAAYAELVGAKPPRRIPRFAGRLGAGPYGIYLLCEQRGASNARMKRVFGWKPQQPSWRDGMRALLARPSNRRA